MGEVDARSEIAASHGYRSLLKGMGVFGGVQLLQTLLNVLRGKFVAVLLGPEGMGIASLFNSSAAVLQQGASMGLPSSIVREIASMSADSVTGDSSPRLAAVIGVVRRMVMLTALVGVVACVGLSYWLSFWSFGSEDYTWQYVAMAAAVGLSVLASGEFAVLQGLHCVRSLARATLAASLAALLCAVPLYWLFGAIAIVPAMILVALCTWVVNRRAVASSVCSVRDPVTREVRRMISRRVFAMGVVLMAGTFAVMLVRYGVNAFIRGFGSVGDVGLYQASATITVQYVGMIFTAMSLDYFPRLSAVSGDFRAMAAIVNRQFRLVSLLMAPLCVAVEVTAPWLIRILLSEEFMPVADLVRWMALALYLRGLSYPFGYVAFARGDRRVYLLLECVYGAPALLMLSCGGYLLWGIDGLGIAGCIVYLLDIIVYGVVIRRAYGVIIAKPSVCMALALTLLVAVALAASLLLSGISAYAVSGICLVISAYVAWKELRCLIASKS